MLLSAGTALAESPVQHACAATGGDYSKAGPVESCCYQATVDAEGHHCTDWIGTEHIGNTLAPGVEPVSKPITAAPVATR